MLIILYHRTHACFSQYQDCNRIVQHLIVPNSIGKNQLMICLQLSIGIWYSEANQINIFIWLTQFNVTVCYKQKWTFFNQEFDQICPKIATFRSLFGIQNPKAFRHAPVNICLKYDARIFLLVITYSLPVLNYLSCRLLDQLTHLESGLARDRVRILNK